MVGAETFFKDGNGGGALFLDRKIKGLPGGFPVNFGQSLIYETDHFFVKCKMENLNSFLVHTPLPQLRI